ncbi:MAG: energy-coupling factor ABC transporter ATP-binding protein [Candidatus Hodarchaeales archaeon]
MSINHKPVRKIAMINVEFENVNFMYVLSQKPALKGVSFKCKQGEIAGIIGSTGSGKSTICCILNGLIPEYLKGELTGTVKISGKDISGKTVRELSKRVALLFQEPDSQVSSSTVVSELAFGLQNQGVNRKVMIERMGAVVDRMKLQDLIGKQMASLSTGEIQLVILASLIVLKPEILVLDEPVSMLDSTNTSRLRKILMMLASSGTTVIIIEHDLEFLLTTVERVIGIKNGSVIVDGQVKDVLLNRETLERLNLTVTPYMELK